MPAKTGVSVNVPNSITFFHCLQASVYSFIMISESKASNFDVGESFVLRTLTILPIFAYREDYPPGMTCSSLRNMIK